MFKNPKINKAVSITISVLLSIVILIILFFTVYAFSANKNEGIPQFFGKSYMVVLSDSMSAGNEEYDFKGFSRGDIITIKRYTWMEASGLTFKKGDIITFEWHDNTGKLVYNTHRIIEVNLDERYYITQGDNAAKEGQSTDPNDGHAEKVYFLEVVGSFEKVSARGLGSIILFMQTATGFLIFVVIPLVAFLGFEIFNFVKVFKQYKLEKDTLLGKTKETETKSMQEEIERLKAELEKAKKQE